MKKILEILSVKFQLLVVKFSIYLNRRVFVMSILFGHVLDIIFTMIPFQVILWNL